MTVWQYEKFKGEMAIHAFCPICNFHHNPSKLDTKTFEIAIAYQWNYCPMCGEYLYDESEDDVDVVWNERDITDLLEEK